MNNEGNEGQMPRSQEGQHNQTNTTCKETEEEYNAFRYWVADNTTTKTMDGVSKTMFWILFDPGKPGYMGPSW